MTPEEEIIEDELETDEPKKNEWESLVLVEDKPTVDERMVRQDAVKFTRFEASDNGLPLMVHLESSHEGSVLAGRITSVERRDNDIYAQGVFAPTEGGQMLKALMDEGMPLAPSVDLADTRSILTVNETGTGSELITTGDLIGVTVLPMQAQTGTWIRSLNQTDEMVAAATLPEVLPAEWFDDPQLEQLTPMQITADGRVYGHFFGWDACHIGRNDVCMKPERDVTFGAFHHGKVSTDQGDIAVGQITLVGGHAEFDISPAAALAHYDDTRSAVADVHIGHDDFGGWFAGALRPGVGDEKLRVLKASGVSGDWRRIQSKLEPIAILSVNSPGLPLMAEALVASSGDGRHVLALVGAGSVSGLLTFLAGATGATDYPLISRETRWDGNSAELRIRSWASSDGTGDLDTIDFDKYKQGFFWFDSSDPNHITSYKLPYADLIDGKLHAVPKGIFAVAASLQGARGGLDIPEADKTTIKGHVEKYYKKISAAENDPSIIAPWLRGKTESDEMVASLEARVEILEGAMLPIQLEAIERLLVNFSS
ncbi:MAG: hypothetical protein ACR2M4_03130 [Actinomycetota bacterium]